MMRIGRAVGIGAVVALAAAAACTAKEETAPLGAGGTPSTGGRAGVSGAVISGQVRFEGTAPAMKKLKMDADPACVAQHSTTPREEKVVVNANGTLRHVFVYIKEGPTGTPDPAPADPVMLDQVGCRYTPHVFGIQVGQTLVVRNGDPVLHNVHGFSKLGNAFNLTTATQGLEVRRTFDTPEVMVKVRCDVHSWMSTYVGVLPHPFFAVTGEAGAFTLAGLPAGQYTVEAWHELYGTQAQAVTVGEQGTATVAFTFTAQASATP